MTTPVPTPTPTPFPATECDQILGEIRCMGMDFTPSGWALCNGQTLEIRNHGSLYSLLGTTYGGDGHTYFALPDMTGRVAVGCRLGEKHWYPLGGKGGEAWASLTEGMMPAHDHLWTALDKPATALTPDKKYLCQPGANPNNLYYYYGPNKAPTVPLTAMGTTGDNEAHPNMQPWLVMNYYIALEGEFPVFQDHNA